MARVYAGTSGWAYPSWKPDFYPPKLSSAKFLSYYSGRLNSVELNYTFRRWPTAKLLAGWVAATPPDFKFAVKAHQTITHIKRLREAAEFTKEFISSLEPLAEAGKLGPILFQLPPFLKCDVPRLSEFLAKLPRHARAAFEFRHVRGSTKRCSTRCAVRMRHCARRKVKCSKRQRCGRRISFIFGCGKRAIRRRAAMRWR